VSPGTLAVAALMVISGPFFPPSLLQSDPLVDTRRCAVAARAAQSDCALIAAQWAVTTAGAVAAAPPSGGRLHVRIGNTEYLVEQLVYHPKWTGGLRYDVTLLRLAERVPAFPLRPMPGEFPVNVERVAQNAMRERQWISATIGQSPVWDDPGTTVEPKKSALLARVRTLMGTLAGRSTND